jgi:hypothetical protein
MKKLLFAFCMTLGTAAFVNAQDTTSTQSPTDPTSTTPTPTEQPAATETPSTAATQEDGRVKIKSQELPDAVKKSLESQEYRGWLVNSAYKLDGASSSSSDPNASSSGSVNATSSAYGKELYIVELKNGAQTKTVRFDKDGKKLDDEGMENDQK